MNHIYTFGKFCLDPRRRTLSQADTPVFLTSKAFDVLAFLVQNPNRLVTKEELLRAVWGDTFVEEGNLTQYISHLRKALGDNSEDSRLIVTITRKGYQFAGDVVLSHEAEPAGQSAGQVSLTEGPRTDLPPPSDGPTIQRVSKPTRPRRKGVVMALALSALLAASALCIWRYEVYRHRITFAPTDTIVLADVDNRTSDPVFDDALTLALRYEMEQTPYLNLLGMGKTYGTLGQLKLPPATRITAEIARQVCTKTNSKMVIADSIADAGNGYHLEIKALDCASGSTLAEERADVATRDQVVHELGAAATRLRRKLGEPAESLAKFNQPPEKASSASLEALQTDAQGRKLYLAGNPQAALPLFQRGIEIDPDFALLYQEIALANGALTHYDLLASGLTRAYQLRDRMTEKSRLNTEYLYYSDETGELDKAHSVLLRALKLFPREAVFHNNLAHTLLALGQLGRAADVEDGTARLAPSLLNFSSAAGANLNASRLKEAEEWLARADASKFESPNLRVLKARLAFIQGNRTALDQAFDREAHVPEIVIKLRERYDALQGRLNVADSLRPQATKLFSHPVDVAQALVYSALENAEAGRLVQARKIEDQMLQSNLERGQRMTLALSLARTGRTVEAERIANEISQERPSDLLVHKYYVPTVRAAIKLQERDPQAAIELLRETMPYDLAATLSFDFLYPSYIRGLAYLQLGDGRSAAREFQKLIDNPGLCGEFITGPLARLQLGRAQRLIGDNLSARKSYEEFLSIWKDADPDLPIYRQAKAEYARLEKP